MDTEGGFGRTALAVLAKLADDAARQTLVERAPRAAFFKESLSVALQRGNALALLRRDPGAVRTAPTHGAAAGCFLAVRSMQGGTRRLRATHCMACKATVLLPRCRQLGRLRSPVPWQLRRRRLPVPRPHLFQPCLCRVWHPPLCLRRRRRRPLRCVCLSVGFRRRLPCVLPLPPRYALSRLTEG